MTQESNSKRGLAVSLSAIFVLALVMGTGPGVYLVNPDPADPGALRILLGMPIMYVWAVFWYLVQAAVIVAACLWLWDSGEAAQP
jgi:hypothetical protein